MKKIIFSIILALLLATSGVIVCYAEGSYTEADPKIMTYPNIFDKNLSTSWSAYDTQLFYEVNGIPPVVGEATYVHSMKVKAQNMWTKKGETVGNAFGGGSVPSSCVLFVNVYVANKKSDDTIRKADYAENTAVDENNEVTANAPASYFGLYSINYSSHTYYYQHNPGGFYLSYPYYRRG